MLLGVEEGPVVLDHVFPAVFADGLWVVLFIVIGVAVDLADVDVAFVVALDEHIFAADRLKCLLDVADEVAEVGRMIFFPKHCI